MPSESEVLKQSEAAYGQWKEIWRKNAKYHSKHEMKSLSNFNNSGIGKAVLCIANGYSFEQNLGVIKKNQEHCDILVADKCLKQCIDNDIIPDFVMVCDAKVDYETYMESVKDRLDKTILFSNVCANTKWTDNGNWKDIYFFVNKDVLKSHLEFGKLSGCANPIAAATNVSNQMVVLLTQCDEKGPRNFFGYDKILLIGYDYSWIDNYYAFDKTGEGKYYYMRHAYIPNNNADLCNTSTNLLFSARWLDKYIKTYKIPAIQCTKNTILSGSKICQNLAEQMKYRYRPDDSQKVIDMIKYKKEKEKEINEINRKIHDIGFNHYKNLIRTT